MIQDVQSIFMQYVYKGVTMAEKRVEKRKKSQGLKKIRIKVGNGSELSFAVGIGSLVAFWLINVCKDKAIPLSAEIEKVITSGNYQEIYVGMWEGIIFMVGFLASFIAPLLSQWDKKMGIKVSVLLALVSFDLCGLMTVIAQGQVYPFFMVTVWVSSIYIVWLCIGVLKIIYGWLKIEKEEKNQFNVAKLTLIWTVIAFLLGRLMK